MSNFDYRAALKREWHETDNRASWSAGSAAGPNTRRDHALLGAIRSDGKPWVLINHFEEWIDISGSRQPLSSTIYADPTSESGITVHPKGYQNLVDFSATPYPRWVYEIEGVRVIRTVRPIDDFVGFIVEYNVLISNGGRPTIFVRPMITCRPAGALQSEDTKYQAEQQGRRLIIRPSIDAPPVVIDSPPEASYNEIPNWYRNVRLIGDSDDAESVFSPGGFLLPVSPSAPQWLKISHLPEQTIPSTNARRFFFRDESERASPSAATLRRMIWFEGDGDGAFFSVEGSPSDTTLSEALYSLHLTLPYLEGGVITPLLRYYGREISDAPLDCRLLWVTLVMEGTRRGRGERPMAEAAKQVVDAILAGENDDGAVDQKGLLKVKKPGASWWERNDEKDIQRTGYPIEIQALWINALASAEILASTWKLDTSEGKYTSLFLRATETTKKLFWDDRRDYLHDCLTSPSGSSAGDDRREPTTAPLFVQSLRFDVFSPSRTRALLLYALNQLSYSIAGDTPEAGERDVAGFVARFGTNRLFPWINALWWRVYARYHDPVIPRLSIDAQERMAQSEFRTVMPYSFHEMETEEGRAALRFDRPSVLATAAFFTAATTAKAFKSSKS